MISFLKYIFQKQSQQQQQPFDPSIQHKEQYKEACKCEKELYEKENEFILNPNKKLIFYTYDLPIDFQNQNNFIHTTLVTTLQNQSQMPDQMPDIVLLHGYGGSGVTFSKMIKRLSDKYNIWIIDLIGMGLSSRPIYQVNSAEEAIAFFISSLECWTNNINLKQFDLLGHSLGGYIATSYAIKHPQQVNRLILLSPLGFTQKGEGVPKRIQKIKESGTFLEKMRLKFMTYVVKKRLTPSKLKRKLGFIATFLLKKYVQNRFDPPLDKETQQLWIGYFNNIFSLKNGTEEAIHDIMDFKKFGVCLALENQITEKFSVPIHFFYGDKDWMDSDGAWNVVNKCDSCSFSIIPKAGHHINLENPIECCNAILALGQKENETKQYSQSKFDFQKLI